MKNLIDPNKRAELLGWIVIVFLAIFFSVTRIGNLGRYYLSLWNDFFVVPEQPIATVYADGIIEILQYRGYDVYAIMDIPDLIKDFPQIEEHVRFEADGHQFMVTVFTTKEYAMEFSSDESLRKLTLILDEYSVFRLRRTVVHISPADENYAMLIERLIVIYQEAY